MTSRKLLSAATLLCVAFAALTLQRRVHGDADDEMKRLAALMGWKPGTIIADIGAGDGRFAFAAAHIVGPSGKVFATEIDPEKLATLRSEVKRQGLTNLVVLESKEADTNLPSACCDSIFLRRVYHHLTKPAEFDAALVRALKPGGTLAIIDFPPRSGLGPVNGVPANRGGHGIPQKVAIEELTGTGLHLVNVINDWPNDDYLVLFKKD